MMGTSSISRTSALASFAARLSWDEIPFAVRERAKCHLLDTIGVALSGSALPSLRCTTNSFTAFDKTRDCTVIGTSQRLSAQNAALLNGMMAHVFDHDDTHMPSITHPSGVLIPAALAIAELTNANGRALISAVVAGYEVMTRLGLASRPAQWPKRGYHGTSIFGVFGAATVAGKLLNLPIPALTHALGLAASQASGIQQYAGPGEFNDAKRFHSGWPAQAGIVAAFLAASGLSAPQRVLEGEIGLYRTFLGEPAADEGAITRELGSRWETLNLSPKVYSCCQSHQSYMDAALALRSKHKLTPDQIVRVELKVHPNNLALCEPLAEKRRPESPYAALIAMPFCVALMLARGQVGPAGFSEESIHDSVILALADRTFYNLDDGEWSDFPLHRSAWVIVETTDGRRVEERIRFNHGSPQNPLTAGEYRGKFIDVTAGVLDPDRQELLADALLAIEGVPLLQVFELLQVSDANESVTNPSPEARRALA
jgi:2-methylcitrate dehydratase PrpD